MITELNIKRWGNSMGVILPKRLIEEERLKENDKITVQIIKKADLSDIFSSLKRKVSGQKFKDWHEKDGIKIIFFDTYAFIEIIVGNPDYEKYKECLIIPAKLNLIEFHYSLLRLYNTKVADFY